MAKIAILVEKIYEDLELQYPRLRLKEAGHQVEIVGPKAGETYVGKHGYPQKAEKSAGDVRAADYDLIVIPGGTSPDHMRRDGGMVRLVRDAAARQIPLAAICHGPWMLCSTDILRGRRCTSYMSIAHDVANAGGRWVDEECVVDGPVITARCPDDLPSFSNAILQLVSEGKADGVRGKPIAPDWLMETMPASARGTAPRLPRGTLRPHSPLATIRPHARLPLHGARVPLVEPEPPARVRATSHGHPADR